MENETPATPAKSSSKMPIIIVVVIIAIVAVAAIGYTMNKKSAMNEEANETLEERSMVSPTQAAPSNAMTAENVYKDGEYAAEGDYTSPGGAESINVTLTIKDNVVEAADVKANATRPISKKMQESFIGGYKEQVVGKKLDEINLGKVSASSLAPKGFNDAVTKIKAEAKA
jgi:hypothetical protein